MERVGADDGRRRGLVELIARWQLLATGSLTVVAVSLVALLVANGGIYGPETRSRIEAISAVRSGHEAMLDQQNGLRAYAVTGDERFLEAYERGRSTGPAHDARVEELVADDLPSLVLRTRLAQARWTESWAARALAVGRDGGATGESSEELLLEGKRLFDEYREAQAALAGRLLAERDTALDQQEEAITRTAALALVVAAGAAALSWWRSRRLRDQLGQATADIEGRLRQLAAGDLTPRPAGQVPGPSELERVHAGLDVAAAELATSRAALEVRGAEAAQHNHQLAQVLRFAREVAGSLNLRYVLRGLCTATAEIARAERVVVWVRMPAGEALEPVADSSGPGLEVIGLDPVEVGDGLVGRAARFGRIHRATGAGEPDAVDLAGAEAGEGGDVAAVPMVVGAEVIGVLEVRVAERAHLVGATVAVLESLAVQAATAVSAARLHERATELAMTDALTELPNRRRMEADLAKELDISHRYGRPMAFAMADVDHFKSYNDDLGHQAADAALQALGRVLAGSVRAGDTVYRYGGEEIAVLMRETDAEAAEQMAERLRALVEHHFAAPGQPRAVTISVGVASAPAHATGAEALVAAADRALYEAKRGGRNRVVTAT